MNRTRSQSVGGILAIFGVLITMIALAIGRPAMGGPVTPGSGTEKPVDPVVQTVFRVEATTDKTIYSETDTVRLAVRLLNNGSLSVFAGIGPDEPTFTVDKPESDGIPESALTIGCVIVKSLDDPNGICTATVGPDGTIIDQTCSSGRQYSLPLFGMNEVPGHSTGIISWLEIPVGGRSDADADDDGADVIPLEPGLYLIDCYIHGLYKTPMARAQQIIEIR